MNVKSKRFEKAVSDLFSVMGNPFRVKLLYAIGKGEACVCHLEALLNRRQAYISQHLRVMRDAGVLKTRREGKYIFYRIAEPSVFQLVETAAQMLAMPADWLPKMVAQNKGVSCVCPNCDAARSA